MRFAPIIVIVIYLFSVLLLVNFGPVVYHGFDGVSVGIYITAICAAMSIGFALAVRAPLTVADAATPMPSEQTVVRLFNIMVALVALGFAFTVYTFVTSSNVNLDFTALGEAYSEGYKDYEKNSGTYSISFILYSIMAMPTFLVTIWGGFFYKNLSTTKKFVVPLLILGPPVIFTLGAGTQKNIGDLLIYICAIFAIRSAVKGRIITIRTAMAIAIVVVLGTLVLTAILSQRYAAIDVDAFNINSKEISLLSYNIDHAVFKIFGSDFGFSFSVLCGYLTNGYNGLSYALHTPSTWSFMLGSSYSLSVVGERVFGFSSGYLHSYPYLAAIESGWGETRWYTIFSWFASDFTFVGTVPLFGLFAYAYGRVWMESIKFQNPFSILLFCLLSMGAIMMPANNQLMQTPGGLLTLGVTIFLYLRFRRRYNRPFVTR